MADIEITQADRDAAVAISLLFYSDGKRTAIQQGQEDEHPFVKAFARHRQAAIAQQIEKDAGIARGPLPLDVSPESPNYGLGMPRNDFDRGVERGREQAAAAIRAQKP